MKKFLKKSMPALFLSCAVLFSGVGVQSVFAEETESASSSAVKMERMDLENIRFGALTNVSDTSITLEVSSGKGGPMKDHADFTEDGERPERPDFTEDGERPEQSETTVETFVLSENLTIQKMSTDKESEAETLSLSDLSKNDRVVVTLDDNGQVDSIRVMPERPMHSAEKE